jgi:hypothetical protein
MVKKHPAVQTYEDLLREYTGENPPEVPYATDPVGRFRLEEELDRRGIPYPKNWLDWCNWWVAIGGEKRAHQLCLKWKRPGLRH